MSLVIENLKTIILLNPKCGSRTLLKLFSPLCSLKDLERYEILEGASKNLDHLTLLETQSFFAKNFIDISDYSVIISVRNPLDRVYSYYLELKNLKMLNKDWYFRGFNYQFDKDLLYIIENIDNISLNDFVCLEYFYTLTKRFSFENMIYTTSNVKKINIIKLENLEGDLKKIGYVFDNMFRENSSEILFQISKKGLNIRNLFTESSKRIVKNYFKSDIIAGNYNIE
jgi:hypothetical protein